MARRGLSKHRYRGFSLVELTIALAIFSTGLAGFSLLLILVFGVKAGLFPLFFWLPDSYPTAPTTITWDNYTPTALYTVWTA